MQRTKRASYLHYGKEEEISDFSDISFSDLDGSVSASSKKLSKGKKKKRHKFSYVEDLKMLKYIMIENRYDEIKGIALWKDMELLEITTHTSQSMKYHFLNTVIKNLDKFNIDKAWVNTLYHNYPSLFEPKQQKDSEDLLSTLRKKASQVLWQAEAAKKTLTESKQLHNTSLLQEQTEEEQEEMDENDQLTEKVSEQEEDSGEWQERKWKRLLRKNGKQRRQYKVQRQLSTSESETEDSNVVSKETSGYTEANWQDSNTEEPTVMSEYDKMLLNEAKKHANKSNNTSQEEYVSETSCSSEVLVPEDLNIPIDRRSQLRKKREAQKKTFQSSEMPSTSKEELFTNLSLSSKHQGLTSLKKFVTNKVMDGSCHQKNSGEKRKKKSELKNVIEIICDMCTNFQLDAKEVLAILSATNGDVNQAISYLMYGPHLSDVLPWTYSEDKVISSTNDNHFHEILQKRGHPAVAMRLQFLEGFLETL